MENANALEVVLLLVSLFTLARAALWLRRMKGDDVSARLASRNARRIAAGNLYDAKVLLYRISCYVLLWGRAMFTPDDNSRDIWSIIVGLAFIGLAVLEFGSMRRKERDQRELEEEAAAKLAAGHTRREGDG